MSEQIQLSQADSSEGKELDKLFAVALLSLSTEECIQEQVADPTVKPLYELVYPERELKCIPSDYFLNDGLLLRKWAHVVNSVQVDRVVQVVVPSKFRHLVLSTSHDGVAGHLGVKKTHDRVLRHIF